MAKDISFNRMSTFRFGVVYQIVGDSKTAGQVPVFLGLLDVLSIMELQLLGKRLFELVIPEFKLSLGYHLFLFRFRIWRILLRLGITQQKLIGVTTLL